MLSEMKKALLLGTKLGRMTKKEAEAELKKILVVSKVGAKHTKSMLSRAYSQAKKEKALIQADVKKELTTLKRKSTKSSTKSAKKAPAKKKSARRKTAKSAKRTTKKATARKPARRKASAKRKK